MAAAGGAAAEGPDARTQLRGCWELACVLNFFHVFRAQLGLSSDCDFRAEALEDALLEQGCTPPLLLDLHLALLQAMHPRSTIRSWRSLLADSLRNAWAEVGEGPCPFDALPAEAERAYDGLSAVARVRALRALCELRLEAGDDLRESVDAAPDEFHGEPALGQDNRGLRLYYQDLATSQRVYRERSRVGTAVKRTLVRSDEQYTQPGPLLLDSWELVACTGCERRRTPVGLLFAGRTWRVLTLGTPRREEVTALAQELRADRFPGTRNNALCDKLQELAPQVAARLKRDEARRQRQARQKIELEFSNIIWHGRSAVSCRSGAHALTMLHRFAVQGRGPLSTRAPERELHQRGVRPPVRGGASWRARRRQRSWTCGAAARARHRAPWTLRGASGRSKHRVARACRRAIAQRKRRRARQRRCGLGRARVIRR